MIKPDRSNEVFLAWTAAWLESEGWLNITRRTDVSKGSFRIKVGICQKYIDPLKIITEGFPKGKIRYNGKVFILLYHGGNAIDFINPLLQYLTFKLRRAHILIEAHSIISNRFNRFRYRPQNEVDKLWDLKEEMNKLTGCTPKLFRPVLQSELIPM